MTALRRGRADRVELFGCLVDPLDAGETLDRCRALLETDRFSQHVALNVAKVVSVQDDARLRAIVNSCDVISADGQGVVLASRLLRRPVPERVAGIDLMDRLLDLAARRGHKVYFLGAREEVLKAAVSNLTRRHPGLEVAGVRHGYFSDDEAGDVCREIRDSGARLLFVAMSSPRKEYFLGAHRDELGPIFAMGVGGALDVAAGVTQRAPVRWQRAGLEWLYRMLQEPRRLGPRYATSNSRFAVMLAAKILDRIAHP